MPSTWSIRKNGVPSTVAGGLQPAHPRDRDVGEFADQPHHLELVVQPVRREHRDVVARWARPGPPTSVPWSRRPRSQRPVRMMVSEDIPLESTPLSTVMSGATPPGMTVDSHCDITAGSAVTSRLERCRRPTSSTAGSLATGCFLRDSNYDTVGSVMKADPSSVDKAPGAGRPRDPRIDAAILAATADLLVEIGYANLTMAAIAERAGTTKTALYRRWSSKADLVHEAAFPVAPTALTVPAGDIAADVARHDRRRPGRVHQPRRARRAARADRRHGRRR